VTPAIAISNSQNGQNNRELGVQRRRFSGGNGPGHAPLLPLHA